MASEGYIDKRLHGFRATTHTPVGPIPKSTGPLKAIRKPLRPGMRAPIRKF